MPIHRPANRSEVLHAMGLPEWRLRLPGTDAAPKQAPVSEQAAPASSHSVPKESTVPLNDWSQMQTAVHACTACDRHKTRQNAIVGAGLQTADCLIVGEAPSATDDAQCLPFSDQSGSLLNGMLAAIGLSRATVYITQMTKCAGSDAHPPEASETAACSHYLEAQIQLLQPRLIVAFGLTAGRYLAAAGTGASISTLRGTDTRHSASGTPVIVTHDPNYLLQHPAAKAEAWQDLQRATQLLSRAVS